MIRGKLWRHVSGPAYPPRNSRRQKKYFKSVAYFSNLKSDC
jgi:hypothetical protein